MGCPLFLHFPHAAVFWAAWLWVCYPEWTLVRRSAAALKSGVSQDDGSLRLLAVGLQVAVLAALLIAIVWPRPGSYSLPLFATGIVVMIGGSLLRRYCRRLLGSSFTGHVAVAPGQPLITSGPYRYVRHPAYSGGILTLLGFGIALGNVAGAAILLSTAAGVYAYRIHVEERVLRDQLGSAYETYAARRKRLIPFVL